MVFKSSGTNLCRAILEADGFRPDLFAVVRDNIGNPDLAGIKVELVDPVPLSRIPAETRVLPEDADPGM